MNNLTKKIYRTIERIQLSSWIICMSLCILSLPKVNSQCYTTVGNNVTFTSSGQNTSSDYTTMYVMTDYTGTILATSLTNNFPANNSGVYKIYGVNYLTSAGITNTNIGGNVTGISSTCYDISEPFEFVICPSAGATCETFDGQYTFNTVGGNSTNTTVYVLTTLNQTITQISTTPSFTGIAAGEYLIFPVNYNNISGLTVGGNFSNISGSCYDVGNPLYIKSCESCTVFLGEDIELCQSQSLLLTTSSSSSGTYSWSTGQTGSNIMITPTQSSQTYRVTFTNTDGCVAQDEIMVKILGNPVSNAGLDRSICYGTSTNLTAQTVLGASYQWSTGSTTQTIQVSPISTQTYTLTVTVGECFAVSEVDVTVNAQPTINISGNTVICNGSNTTLTASGGSSYNWSDGSTTSTIIVSPTLSTTYTVTVTDVNGCSAEESTNVTVSNCDLCTLYDCNIACNECAGDISFAATSGNPLLTNSFALVDGTGNILKLTNGTTFTNVSNGVYFIFGINYDNTKPYSGLQVGGNIYSVTGDCLDVGEPYVIKVCDNPIGSISGNAEICSGASTILTASGGSSYVWSNGMTTSSITVSPISTTNYRVTVTNANGCTAQVDTMVTVNNCGQIGNFVWEDMNGNGIQDNGEPGIGGVEIILFKNGVQVASTFTNPEGMYMFTGLEPGDYTLMFNQPQGYTTTVPNLGNGLTNSDINQNTGLTTSITVSGNYTNEAVDAGYYKLAKIGDYVWEDMNKNGIQDNGEPGISNVQVILTGTTGSGQVVNLTTNTDESGMYMFNNLIPGSYTVSFVKPTTDYTITTIDAMANSDDGRDSDANVNSGTTGTIVLTSGENDLTIDAGMYRCSKIGDYVWLDNGTLPDVQDANDTGLNGVVVLLYSTSNPTTPVQTVVTYLNPETNKSGYYQFEVCTPGNYFIKVVKSNEYNFVVPGVGTEELDSDITDLLNGLTNTITVDYGVNSLNVDFGLKSIPLPVKLIEFSGERDKERNENTLWWITESEVNSDYFTLERSYNGSAYEKIATIEGAGNSNTEIHYEYVDIDSKRGGTYIYRLLQTDYDGRTEIYGPVTIQVSETREVNVLLYPNPSVNTSYLEINAPVGSKIEGQIYDATGKLVRGGIFDTVLEDGYIMYNLDAQSYAEGVYTIHLMIDGNIQSYRWIVIK